MTLFGTEGKKKEGVGVVGRKKYEKGKWIEAIGQVKSAFNLKHIM